MSSLTYTQRGGLMVPNLTQKSILDKLGRLGLTARKYLLENRFDLFQEMLVKGTLNSYLLKLDKRYSRLYETVSDQLRAQEAPPTADSFREKAQYEFRIKEQAEEIVLNQLTEELDALA